MKFLVDLNPQLSLVNLGLPLAAACLGIDLASWPGRPASSFLASDSVRPKTSILFVAGILTFPSR